MSMIVRSLDLEFEHPCEECGLDEGHKHQLNGGNIVFLCYSCSPDERAQRKARAIEAKRLEQERKAAVETTTPGVDAFSSASDL
jgi:hypothetical protein